MSVRNSAKRHVDVLWLVTPMAMLLCTGCATTKTAPDAGTPSSNAPSLDPARAHVTLRRISPDPPAPTAPEAQPVDLSAPSVRRLSRAMERYAQHRFTEASLELEKALRHDPEHPRLHRAIARSLHRTGNLERVRAHLRKAIAADPDDVITHCLLGRLAYEDGRNEDSIREYRVALKCSNAPAHQAYVAVTYFHLARVLNAERYLTASIECYQAYEQVIAGLPPEARTEPELASLLEINGGDAGGPISVAYEKLGRFDEAADALTSSIRDRDADPDTRERLVRLLARAGRFERALAEARKLLDDSARAVNLLVEVHERAGHPHDVVDDIRSLYDAHPERSDLLMAYVDVLSQFKRWQEAERVLQHAAELPEPEIAVYWRLADVYLARGEWSKVIQAAANALRADPIQHRAARDKVLELAEEDRAVIRLLGTDTTPRTSELNYAEAFLLGSVATGADRDDQAIAMYRRALEDRPGFIPARVGLAEILIARFRWHDVLDLTASDEKGLRNDAHLHRLRGEAYAGLDDFENADNHFATAIRLNRTDTEAMFEMAELLRDNKNIRRAQRQYESLLSVNPLHEASREALFELYLFALDRRADAAEQLAELRRLAASPHRIARCQARLDLGRPTAPDDWDQYRNRLTEAVDKSGPDVRTIAMIAQSHLAQNDPDVALAALERVPEHDREDTDYLIAKAEVYQRLLDYRKAVDTMDRLLRRHPNRVSWIDWRLHRLMEDHRFTEAYESAANRLAAPDLPDRQGRRYRTFVQQALQGAKDFDRAIELLDTWLTEQPEDAFWTQLRDERLEDAERFDEAIAAARQRYVDRPAAESRDGLWQAYLTPKRYVQARQLLLSELEDDPLNELIINNLVWTLMLAERHDDALELLKVLRDGDHPNPNLDHREATVLQHGGRYDQAIRIWEKRVREAEVAGEDGAIAQSRMELAAAMIGAMRLDEVVTKLRRWIDETESPILRFMLLGRLAACHQVRGEIDSALEIMQRQFDLKDDVRRAEPAPGATRQMIIGVHNDFGYTLADAGRRIQEAKRMVRYAVSKSPMTAAYLDSYGWVLYKSGEFAEARRWLEKAIASPDGEDAVVYDHLGDTLWRLGLTEQAAERWKGSVGLIEKDLETIDRPDQRELRGKIKAKIEACDTGQTPELAPLAPELPQPISDGDRVENDSES